MSCGLACAPQRQQQSKGWDVCAQGRNKPGLEYRALFSVILGQFVFSKFLPDTTGAAYFLSPAIQMELAAHLPLNLTLFVCVCVCF